MVEGETVRAFHEQTKNRPGALRRRPRGVPGFTPMHPWSRPAPFKRYPGTTLQPLPTGLPSRGPAALEVLSGQAHPEPAAVDDKLLARLLFFSGGVTRVLGHGRHRLYFRTAASAGNLHPLETYLVCGAVPGVSAGVFHFAPDVFGLECLRDGDYRAFLATATADSGLASTPAGLVITGIPWRTAWKYGERGWRHLYWDVGTMLANLLAVAQAHGIGVRVLFGFGDTALCRLLGIDGTTEFPLVVLSLYGQVAPSAPTQARRIEDMQPLHLEFTPVSQAPIEFPLITAAQHAGVLDSADAVRAWRAAAPGALPAAAEVAPGRDAESTSESIEAVILRRGSSRAMRHAVVPAGLLVHGIRYATRPVGADALRPDRTVLRYLLSVHAVDGIQPGRYEFRDGELQLRRRQSAEQARLTAAHLCLDQELGGDSAYTAFICTDLDDVLDNLGDRGYRVVQTEAGIVAGRLQLTAFAFGYGATALTFYDGAVSAAFGSRVECMMACAAGVPAYRSRPGGPPLRPAELGVASR
jgi:SagB-type dehydrogenase family enzyme